jgi:hypothetical protein
MSDSKQNWILASLKYINTSVKEVMSLPLLQVVGGNPTFPKVRRSDILQTCEI